MIFHDEGKTHEQQQCHCQQQHFAIKKNLCHNSETVQFTPQNSLDPQAAQRDFSPDKLHNDRFRYRNNYFGSNDSLIYENYYPAKIQELSSDTEFTKLYELNPETLNASNRFIHKKRQKNNNLPQKKSIHRAGLHEARDKRTSSPRVVKIIDKSRLPASAGGELLWRRLCHKLLQISPQHRGLMTITDVYESPQKFYIVSENLLGGELFEFLLYEKAVPEELCKYIIKQILQALHFLHSCYLVHRDVKPENLMFRRARPTVQNSSESTTTHVCTDKKTRVMSSLECSQIMTLQELSNTFELAMIDFDTCKMTDATPSEYQDICNGRRRLVGTYGYLAPEVLKGHEYTQVSDLWSVGVILYILITGAPPVPMELMVNAQTSLEILENIRREGIEFQLAPFPEFTKAQDLCRGLLEFDPNKRILSAKLALEHPWLHSTASNTVPTQMSLYNKTISKHLMNYSSKKKLTRKPLHSKTHNKISPENRVALLLVNELKNSSSVHTRQHVLTKHDMNCSNLDETLLSPPVLLSNYLNEHENKSFSFANPSSSNKNGCNIQFFKTYAPNTLYPSGSKTDSTIT